MLVVATLVFVLTGKSVLAGWTPDRTTFTWQNPASYITFNSITDNPVVGDERAFYTVRDAAASTSTYADSISVSNNQELVLRIYFHNNAGANLGLVAHNTRVKINLPQNTATSLMSIASISADNANPGTVTDTVGFTGSQPFSLEYEPGTAILRTNALNDVQLSDSIVTGSGAQIGYNAVNGDVPGCAEFSGWVALRVRVHVQPQVIPAYSCNLLNVAVLPNRKVNASVDYTATGGAVLNSVTFDWGDGSTPLLTSSPSASHTYTQDGTYTIWSTLAFNVGGAVQYDYCSNQVSFATPPPPPSTPPVTPPPAKPAPPTTPPTYPPSPPSYPPTTPQVGKTLPNTGTGSLAALFAGVSTFAGVSHYFVTRRRS